MECPLTRLRLITFLVPPHLSTAAVHSFPSELMSSVTRFELYPTTKTSFINTSFQVFNKTENQEIILKNVLLAHQHPRCFPPHRSYAQTQHTLHWRQRLRWRRPVDPPSSFLLLSHCKLNSLSIARSNTRQYPQQRSIPTDMRTHSSVSLSEIYRAQMIHCWCVSVERAEQPQLTCEVELVRQVGNCLGMVGPTSSW